MTALELRRAIEKLLKDELGVFTTGTPAIWIEPPEMDAELQTTGLRCVIYDVPIGSLTPMSAGQKLREEMLVVDLVNFDRARSLKVAKEKLETALPQAKQPQYRPRTSRTLETCRFWIYAPRVSNPL